MEFGVLGLTQLGLGLALFALSVRYLREWFRRAGRSLPPGPRGLPFIGNVLDFPHSEPWLKYADWSKRYGDVVYVEALGQPIVILGSLQAATDMFEKNGANCSDRPKSVMFDLCKLSWLFSMMPYGDAWRMRRRAFQAVNLADQVIDYQSGQMADVHALLQNIIENPKNFIAAFSDFIVGNTLRTTYGIKVKGRDDPIVLAGESLKHALPEAMEPGKWMPDLIPALRFVPSWIPGAAFAHFAAHVQEKGLRFRELTWTAMEAAQSRGVALPSMATRMLEHLPDQPDKKEIAAASAAQAYIAGVDTTLGALVNLMYAVTLHPETQAKAQAELDTVIGRSRLPEFRDRDSLPYVDALLKETLRWQVLSPVAVPHATVKDDQYRGFFIPAKTIVIANSWAFLNDPAVYPSPDLFQPERFLRVSADGALAPNTDVLDPRAVVFGFGRRTCPGRSIADNLFFAAATSLLATMDFSRPADEHGEFTSMREEWTTGIFHALASFECTIRPRDEHVIRLVRESVEAGEGR